MKKAIIHIGAHKTGSTAIQQALFSTADALKAQDIVFPLELTVPQLSFFGQHLLPWNLLNRSRDFPDLHIDKAIDQLRTVLQDNVNSDIILSTEEFSWLTENEISLLLELFNSFEIHVVMYVRRQDEAASALYQTEILYSGQTNDFEQWLSIRKDVFDYFSIAERWSKGTARKTIVRMYDREKLKNRDVISDFENVVSGIFNKKVDLYRSNSDLNVSVPASVTSVIRYYNGQAIKDEIVPLLIRLGNEFASLKINKNFQLIDLSVRKSVLEEFHGNNLALSKKYLGLQENLFSDNPRKTDHEWQQSNPVAGSDLLALVHEMLDFIAQSINKSEQKSQAIDDNQADVFRNEALIFIEDGKWESALEKLKLAHSIRPNGSYIKLLLIQALVHLKKFDDITPHLDFLKKPPNHILNEPSLIGLLHQLRSILSLSDKRSRYKGLHDEAKKLSIEDWIAHVGNSTEQNISLGEVAMPSVPPPEKQAIFNGISGVATINSAARVYEYALQACQRQGIDSISTLLDFGCGWGRFTRLFVRDVEEAGLIGVDPWDEALQMCREHMPYAAFVRSQVNPPLMFRDELFDVVFANSIFSHLSEPNSLTWIKEITRVLRPGGVFIATTHSKHWLEQVRKFQSGERPCESDWHQAFKDSTFDFTKAVKSHQNGEFVFVATGGISGNPDYGDSFVPEQYVHKIWGEFLEFVEFIDDPDRFPQATFTLRKPAKK